MNPEKKWRRYTQVGNIFVNLTKYRQNITPVANGCIEWRGSKHKQGYGMMAILNSEGKRKMTVVHRVAMRLKLGRELTPYEDVRHACGNPGCCNPSHLYIRNEQIRNELTTKIPSISQ